MVEQRHRMRQLVDLPWRQHEGYGVFKAVGENADFRAVLLRVEARRGFRHGLVL